MDKSVLVIGLVGNSLFYSLDKTKVIYEEAGGKGFNQAIALSKLGVKVSFCGVVGDDSNGKNCMKTLDNYHVNNHIIVKKGTTTYALIYVDEKGNNDIITSWGACFDLNDLESIKKLISIHDYVLLQNEVPWIINEEIIKEAIIQEKVIIVNPAPFENNQKFLKYLNNIFLLTPNEIEAINLFPEIKNKNYLEFGEILYNKKIPTNLIVTLGENGALLVTKDNYQYAACLKVKAVDTTGAGDMLSAATVYGLINNMCLEDALNFSIKASSYSVTKKYVLDSYPVISDLK